MSVITHSIYCFKCPLALITLIFKHISKLTTIPSEMQISGQSLTVQNAVISDEDYPISTRTRTLRRTPAASKNEYQGPENEKGKEDEKTWLLKARII